MDFSTFMNASRILWNIDRRKLPDLFPATPEGNQNWIAFIDHPHRFIARTDDETAIAIWNAMCERDKRLSPTTFEQYAESLGVKFS